MKDDYENGKCHICQTITEVRWKNIYHIGSEGLWTCMKCERKILDFIQDLKRENHLEIIKLRRSEK